MGERDKVDLVLAAIQEDIRHVHIRVTAAVGLAAVFLTQLPFEDLQRLSHGFRVATVAAVGLVVLAAVLLFHYTQELNKCRINIVHGVTAGDAGPALGEWRRDFGTPGSKRVWWLYVPGLSLLVAGAVMFGVILAELLHLW